MGQIWLAYCEDAYYGRVREEVLRRGGDARIARVNSAEGAIQLGRACATGSVGVIVACGASAIDAYANDVLRLRSELGGCELLALSIGGGPVCAARLLQAGATEVIAEDDDVDGGRRSVGSGSAAERRGDVCRTAVGCGALPCEADLVPVEELWPPLDEPDGQAAPMAPVASSGDEPMGRAPFDAAPETAWGNRPDGPHCEDAAVPAVAGSLREIAAQASAIASMGEGASRAPLVTVVSGRGGVGKTTLVAALAACSARAGLRAAVLDLDLMCGDLPSVFGVDGFKGMEGLVTHERDGVLAECDVEATAMRIGPGLTLWGAVGGRGARRAVRRPRRTAHRRSARGGGHHLRRHLVLLGGCGRRRSGRVRSLPSGGKRGRDIGHLGVEGGQPRRAIGRARNAPDERVQQDGWARMRRRRGPAFRDGGLPVLSREDRRRRR